MKTIVVFFALYTVPIFLFAQNEETVSSDDHTLLSVFNYLFLPRGIVEGYRLRDDILSNEFIALPKGNMQRDRERFDLIYEDAYFLCKGDLKESLLATLIGVFEHKTIPIKFFGAVINLPLSLESSARFDERISRLPEYIYSDRVKDRDKLQHFFISAYLKKVFGSGWLVRGLGELVEIGEDLFIIGGANDRRDVVANNDGIRFAITASTDSVASPSHILSPNH